MWGEGLQLRPVLHFVADGSFEALQAKRSEALAVPAKGTPQGWVISPLLFNIAMIKVPEKLTAIPGLIHAIYADEITFWTTRGLTGNQVVDLQEAVYK